MFPLQFLTWNRCCLGAGILSIHCCIIAFCPRNVWVRRNCLPAPSPEGSRVRSCNRSVWHVQILRTGLKKCDAKRAAVTHHLTNLPRFCCTLPRKTCLYFLRTASPLLWVGQISAKSVQIFLLLPNVTVCSMCWRLSKMLSWENCTLPHREQMLQVTPRRREKGGLSEKHKFESLWTNYCGFIQPVMQCVL